MATQPPATSGHGLPLSIGFQFLRLVGGVSTPINISAYTQIQMLVKHTQGAVTQLNVQMVNTLLGMCSGVLASTTSMLTGKYEIEINYIDELGAQQYSNIGEFTLTRTLKGELLQQEAANV